MKIWDSPYRATTEAIQNRHGTWNSLCVSIWNGDAKIGEYVRNYHSLFNTFHPFRQGDQHYALYSKDYTSTRVMSLPDCKDLGGEPRHAFGFCPTGYAVPDEEMVVRDWDPKDPKPYNPRHDLEKWPNHDAKEFKEACNESDVLFKAWDERHPFKTVPLNAPFGFICGCVWGDDSSWKIQYLDLSRASEGIVVRDDRFGYIELLGDGDDLAAAIEMNLGEYEGRKEWYIDIAVRRRYDLAPRDPNLKIRDLTVEA